MIFNQLTGSLGSTLKDYSTLNDMLSSGKKLLAPSDDPGGLMRAIDYKVGISANTQFGQNINLISTQLKFTNTTLESAQNALATVMGFTTKTIDPQTQASDAQIAASWKNTLLDLANMTYGGQSVFAGFKSDTQAYASGTYDYQGDAGLVNVPVDRGSSVAVNVPGSSAFSYTIGPEGTTYTKLVNGQNVHYTQGPGTTINVDIYDPTDTTVLDSFQFSNVIQMADLVSTSIQSNDTMRLAALREPFSKAQSQMIASITDVGQRIAELDNRSAWLTQNTSLLKSALSPIEDADQLEVIAKLKQTEITLSAIRDSASRVLSQSLLDFLK